jgi:hypothetical protein
MSQPLLSAADIFAAKDLAEEIVDVPEWGGAVRFVQMSAGETAEFTDSMQASPDATDGMYLIVVYCAKDADGARLFITDDVPALKKKSMEVLNKLQRICLRLNKMGKEGADELKKD